MKNGDLEAKDAETLKKIYNKIDVMTGTVSDNPITLDEQILLFCIAEWIERNVHEG